MKLSKLVTSNNSIIRGTFSHPEVTEVTVAVTNKSIDRDIIYNIVTSVTSFLTYTMHRARTHAHVSILNFRGNRGNRNKNTYAEVEKSVTSVVTSLPLNLKSYPTPVVTPEIP